MGTLQENLWYFWKVRCIQKEKSVAFLVLNFEELTRYVMSGSDLSKNRHVTSKALLNGRVLSIFLNSE